jgi:hypothetical protein
MILTTARCLIDRRFLFADDATIYRTKPHNMVTISTDCWVHEYTITICDRVTVSTTRSLESQREITGFVILNVAMNTDPNDLILDRPRK